MKKEPPFFDGTYWDFCIRTAPDCFHIFQDGAADIDFDRLNEKIDESQPTEVPYAKSVECISLNIVYTILRNIFPADIPTENIVRLEKDELQRLRTSRLFIEEPPGKYDSFVKRPYYRMRGKPVTKEQALDVIRKSDASIVLNSRPSEEFINSTHFTNTRMERSPFSMRFRWMHPNGIVGINYWFTYKWPEFLELLDDLLQYQSAFPFLDFTAAITWWDEYPYYTDLPGYKGQKNEILGQYPEFLDAVVYGVRLSGSTIEFMGENRAVKTYRKYDELYSDPDFRIYIPQLSGD